MKILEKKEFETLDYYESIDLNHVYAGKKDVSIGILLLYILVNQKDFQFITMEAKSDGDIGDPIKMLFVDESNFNETFGSLENLSNLFKEKELIDWKVIGIYKNVEIRILSDVDTTIFDVLMPIEQKINLIPLMNDIETETWEYHDFNKKIIEEMKRRFNIKQKMAVTYAFDFNEYPELWNEFSKVIQSDPFIFPKENAVKVEGYTAEMLYNNYPLSVLGSYNYLIYLKKDAVNALNDLKKGLPRK